MLNENVLLKEFTTMRTGGLARYFFCVKTIKEVKTAVLFAKIKNIPIFVLGGGSNVLISDDGFIGVVIKMELGGIDFINSGNEVRVTAGAGIVWDSLVEKTIDKNLHGLENLSFIPGTVGASPVQNIGAYGVEVKDVIVSVEVLNTETMDIEIITNKECLFSYRDSFFKSQEGKKFIILNVTFSLKKNNKIKTDYKDIKNYFYKKNITPTLKNLRDVVIEIRTNKLPDIKKVGTVGSFFKNPIITNIKLKQLLKVYPNINYHLVNDNSFKLSGAWLIDNVGCFSGICRGSVCVYKKQSLVIINNGNATTSKIILFANEIQNNIKNKTGISLEFEVNII